MIFCMKINMSKVTKKDLKKGRRDEVDILYTDKHLTLLQVDLVNLGGHGQQTCPNYPK